MYLKSIEIRGFKSFADRTLLNFKDGITAVVGPNGSGKSNISDAVRWVLGEQKIKSLRGGKMEDVIFSGTDFRKPLGFAEVTLLLDNSGKSLPIAYQEVSVTRKLYRSGESDYMINNTSCRLRDIQELFMDTGIGKEGYSLIGQGKIEAILSGKMEDRRSLLEEAAGIVKYKSRKEESEKKLFNTEQNLLRVNDILNTYDERIGPLEREKEKAEKFLVYSKEQRQISISLILSDLEDFEVEKISLDDNLVKVTRRYQEVEKSRNEIAEKYEALESSVDEKKAVETELKEEFYKRREASDASQSEIKLLKQSIEDRRKNLVKNESIVGNTEKRIKEEKDNLSALQKEISEGEEKTNEVSRFLSEKKLKQEALSESLKLSEEAQKGLRDEEEDTDLKISNLTLKAKESYRDRDTLKGRIENSLSIIANYEASLSMNETAKENTRLEINDVKVKLEEEEKALRGKNENKKEILAELDQRDKAIKALDYDIRGKESQRNLLKNLEEHYEGYTRSVKSLMTHLKASNDKRLDKVNLVGEVIKPKEGFELALEVALGSAVNNIITQTDKDAKELIDLLRARNFGRATFFPLNIIKGFKAKSPELKRGNLLGNLYDLVQFDKKYEGIAANLLGRIFVAKNMDEAIISAKEMGYTMRIVTLEGDIINSGGSMTGGSMRSNSSGIFSRKKDLEELTSSLETLRLDRQKEIEARAGIEKVLEVKLKEEREASYLINSMNMTLAKLTERHEGFSKDMDRLKNIILESKKDLQSKNFELEILEKTISEMEEKVQDMVLQKDKNKDYLRGIKEKRTQEFKENDELKDFIMTESIKEGRLQEALKAKKEAMLKSSHAIEEMETELLLLDEEMSALNDEIKEALLSIDEKEKSLVFMKEDIEQREKILEEMAMEEIKVRARLKEQSNFLRTMDEEFHQLDKDLFKLKDSLEKLEKERTNLINKINDEMNLTLAEAKEERVEIIDKDMFRKRLNELRRQITSLGNVNVAAIEEFREVSEHSLFLKTQKDDLEKAKLELKELIMDMTIRMRTLFSENFKVMNDNFNDTFKRLFQGGTAKLILGEGDILEAPIEISVQPPGKKLQNITLMSGGEKVLSAIALTFAILRMKPTPFCILDEIEAALDDANVYRFAEFLTEFARDTQFILITHRKGTMEAADALYGVTMEEKGISKIISMDLSEIRSKNG